ncbi:hypothetical protein MPLDJ20_130050 [Mesorhizobium plurifarium]|uniref:Uncharacterized protein n=1 Tax=Mesorhizobium plurifarium TaxID=69974 RepID=A0A090GGE1_MESPL|nr:hypothetical protein MPLDJ20_130050 [Mesorhizobium plurifarium]
MILSGGVLRVAVSGFGVSGAPPDQRDAVRQTAGLCAPLHHQARRRHRPAAVVPGVLRGHQSQHQTLETAPRPQEPQPRPAAADPDLLRRQEGAARPRQTQPGPETAHFIEHEAYKDIALVIPALRELHYVTRYDSP